MSSDTPIMMHWPTWMMSAGNLLRSNSLVRSRCCQCHALLRVDLASYVAHHGQGATLIDRRERCAVVGCTGSTFYLASWSYGRTWRALLTKPLDVASPKAECRAG